jgi:hypothetical protein
MGARGSTSSSSTRQEDGEDVDSVSLTFRGKQPTRSVPIQGEYPVTPAEMTDFKDWPRVERFVKKRISMQYDDLRKLMQKRGFNLLVVAGLCDLVSGLSVSLYKPAVTKKWIAVCGTKKQVELGSGELFKLLLEAYYPWQKDERRKRKSEIIYKFVRNPLVHSLGQGKRSDRNIIAAKCKKDKDNNIVAWTDQELDAIERSNDLDDAPMALKRSGNKWMLVVEHFYVGLFKLLRKLGGQDSDARSSGPFRKRQVRLA